MKAIRTCCALMLIAATSAAASSAPAAEKSTKKAAEKPNPSVVAVFSLDRPIVETPREDFFLGSSAALPLKTLVERLKAARDDEDVKAVVFLLGSTSLGAGQIEEIRGLMDQIKAAGKDVHVHADTATTGSYLLLSGASRLSIVPTGYMFLTGLNGEALYIRGLLDKIAVTPDYLTCGAYKSAAETFMCKAPSPEADEMTNWLFDSMYESYVELIASGRNTTAAKVRKWIDGGIYTADEALKQGIVDAVEYRPDFIAALEKKYGEDVEFDAKYGRKKSTDIDLSSPLGLFQLWAKLIAGPSSRTASKKDSVAIVYVDGPIMTGKPTPSPFSAGGIAYSSPIRKALHQAAEDDSIKAVVLRVDSPGGSAVASEIILNATKKVKAAKPLVVSMGNMAGSGGYYVACGADTIFADNLTLTASIGVVGGKFATTEMWDKIGVSFKSYKRGRNADLLSSETVFTKPQRQKVQAWMDDVYGVFKGHVTAIRGDRLKKDIDELAGGRVFTGRQALELGLVDKIGGLDDAIEFIAKEAGLKEYEIRVVPRLKNPLELLFADLSDGEQDDSHPLLSLTSPAVRTSSLLEVALPLLEGLDPARFKAARTALMRLDMLQQDGAVLMMPEIVIGE